MFVFLCEYGIISKRQKIILFENPTQTAIASPCRMYICRYITGLVSSINNLKTVFWTTSDQLSSLLFDFLSKNEMENRNEIKKK